MSSKTLADKLRKKGYRDAYVASHVGRWVAYQVRTLREQRGWSQSELGDRMGTSQSNICRIENPDYGRLSQQTLLQLASTFDVALVIMFVDYPTFLEQSRDVSSEAMVIESFDHTALEPRAPETPAPAAISGAPASNINFGSTEVQSDQQLSWTAASVDVAHIQQYASLPHRVRQSVTDEERTNTLVLTEAVQ